MDDRLDPDEVREHLPARCVRVAGGDRLSNRAVMILRVLGAARNAEDRRQRTPDHFPQRAHRVQDHAVARRLGDREVEAQVAVDVGRCAVAVAPLERSGHLRDRGVHQLEVRLGPPLGRETGGLAFEDAPQFVDVEHRRLVEVEQELQARVERVGPAARARSTAADVLDDTLRLQHAQGLANGGAPRPERLGQLPLGRQGVARMQPAAADPAQQLIGDQLVDLLALDRLVAQSRLAV